MEFFLKFLAFVALIGLAIYAVSREPVQQAQPVPDHATVVIQPPKDGGWTVTLECEFDDSLTYSGHHRIYRIRNKDGTELIGITGIGIQESGSHRSGKVQVEHE